MSNKKHIICSGLKGFIGTSLQEFFKDEIVFYDFTEDYQEICSKKIRYDAFINLATRLNPSMENITTDLILDDIRDNINFYNFFKQNEIDKFIFTSSAGALGPVSLDNAKQSKSHYANNKRFLENTYCLDDGSNQIFILRCTNIYGPRQTHKNNHGLIPMLVNNIKKNLVVEIWGDGGIRKNFLYIDDFCRLVGKIVSSGNDKHGIYNVGDETSHTINELLALFEKTFQKKINVRYLESKETDNSLNEIDISQAKQIFGWTPTTSLEDGIKKIYEY
jgi:nucleoside-diphosphate-sugar epimerase